MDEMRTCYVCGGAKDNMIRLLCGKCREEAEDTEVCPSCDGQGDVQLHDEGGNGMYWGCMACGGTGRVKR